MFQSISYTRVSLSLHSWLTMWFIKTPSHVSLHHHCVTNHTPYSLYWSNTHHHCLSVCAECVFNHTHTHTALSLHFIIENQTKVFVHVSVLMLILFLYFFMGNLFRFDMNFISLSYSHSGTRLCHAGMNNNLSLMNQSI